MVRRLGGSGSGSGGPERPQCDDDDNDDDDDDDDRDNDDDETFPSTACKGSPSEPHYSDLRDETQIVR